MDEAMAAVVLGWYAAFFLVGLVARVILQRRRTGSFGVPGFSRRLGPVGWWAGVLAIVAIALCLAGPVLQLAGVLAPVGWLDALVVRVAGSVLAVAGLIAVVVAQQAMGASWRAGVDLRQTTDLVTGGPFWLVRNPIFTAMIGGIAGVTLLAPNPVALAGLAVVIVAIELQVRGVEEPYLLRTHGDSYAAYTRRVGRFVPGVGVQGRSRATPSR